MRKIFLDTNIILDLLDSDRQKHKEAVAVVDKIITENFCIVITEDMLTTLFYISKNKPAVLEFIRTIVDEWEVVSFGGDVIKSAIEICQKNQNIDLEDVLQCLCAKREGCELLVTNDKKFYNCGIKIVSSSDFGVKNV